MSSNHGTQQIILDLPSSTLAERTEHANLLLDLEAKKIASTLDVPTLPNQVRDALRDLGEPVRLFGENNATVRDRLRHLLAKIEISKRAAGSTGEETVVDAIAPKKTEEQQHTSTKYTHASPELIAAREHIAVYSLDCARRRLSRERKRRWAGSKRTQTINGGKLGKQARLLQYIIEEELNNGNSTDISNNEQLILGALDELDDTCHKTYETLRNTALEGSQYGGDSRPLSAICTSKLCPYNDWRHQSSLIATGGWSGNIKLWDGSSSALDLLSTKLMAHEDRIMGIAMQPLGTFSSSISNNESSSATSMLATASIDLTGKLWTIKQKEDVRMDTADEEDVQKSKLDDEKYSIEEAAILKGHEARLCSVAFHPSGRYVGTTSFDHTFRLWDVETGGKEILLQDGHWKEVYGIGFHPDGSLVSTTDFGSVVMAWDLRTGKSACNFLGHAKRVICSEFSPNGFQLATAGDDGTIKIWDLRQRKLYASIPAHSGLITQLKFAHDNSKQNGEYLASSSFDGTGKVWSTRDWKMISTLRGHEGKVMGIDVLDGSGSIVTCGYDKTMKIWI